MPKIPVIIWCDHEFTAASPKICVKCKRKKPKNSFNSLNFGKRVTQR